MAIQKYPGTSLEDLRSLLSYSSDSPTTATGGPFYATLDATPPPTYTPTKAIFLRDEKSQAARMEEEDLLDKSDDGIGEPYMFFGLLPTRAFMLPYSIVMMVAFALMAGKAAGSEVSSISVLGAIATAGVHFAVFAGMLLDEHVLMAIASVASTGKLVASVLSNIAACSVLYDRNVCSKLAGLMPRECVANISWLRTVGPLLLVVQVLWETYLVKHVALATAYTGERKGLKKSSKYSRLHDVDTMVGHAMA